MSKVSQQPLAEQKCVPCRANSPALTDPELTSGLAEIEHWTLVKDEGRRRLCRSFAFADWAQAFASQVSHLAEVLNHHPDLHVQWGGVTVYWWTHSIDDLHRNDLIAAAQTNKLLESAAA